MNAIPRLGGALPVVGHMLEFARQPLDLLWRVRRECGEVGEVKLLRQPLVLLTGPEGNERFFRATDDQVSQREPYRFMTPIFGEGIVYDAPGDKMAQQLKMVVPALRDQRMRTYAEVIAKETLTHLEPWSERGEVDLMEFARELTLRSSTHCLLGPELRAELTEELARIYHTLDDGIRPLSYVNPYLPLPAFRRRDRARARLGALVGRIIEGRRRAETPGEDALQTLLETRYQDGSALTTHEITGILIATMFAGHHTSAGTLCWILVELARNPTWRDAVEAEVAEVAGPTPTEVSFAQARKLDVLDRVIREVLRLHPPLLLLIRKVLQPLDFSGLTIPVGSYLGASPPVSHLLPEVFHEPYRFDPDRYLAPRAEDARPFAYVAFGGGKHKCTGNAFGLMQLKVMTCILMSRYRFELCQPTASYRDDYRKTVVQPMSPCRLAFWRRTQAPAPARESAIAPELAAPLLQKGRRYEVSVDLGLCQGHAVCQSEAPELFRVGGGHESQVLTPVPTATQHAALERALRFCPNRAVRAIPLEEA